MIKAVLNKVEICGINTSELKVLSEAEKTALLHRIKQGDEAARTAFVNGNLKLVLSVVQRFAHRGEDPDDLFQIGCIGLIKSIDNFDLTQEVRFSTYAVPMIIGEIRRYLRDNNPIRVSRSLRDTAYKALGAKERLTAKLSREPTIEEISAEMGMKREEIVVALDAIVDPVSLFDSVYNDDSDTIYLMDQVRDLHETESNWVEEISLRQAISRLTDREKRILSLRFYAGKTQTEVAAEIGISQAQVSRVEKNALTEIKKHL